MASVAEIDEAGVVLRVHKAPDQAGDDLALTEQWGSNFWGGTWKKCAYAQPGFRKNYPGSGYVWREDLDGFVAPQPDETHTLDETTCQWKPPSPGDGYEWNGYRWTPPLIPGPPPP